ncbi:MAG: ABC transporter permease [Cytophagales bacterium]
MLYSNLKIIIRQFKNVYAVLNLVGLSVGLTAFILIFLWVKEEISYDNFHTDYSKIFRIVAHQQTEDNKLTTIARTSGPLAEYLKNTYGEITEACKLRNVEFFLKHGDGGFYKKGFTADPSFFNFFHFPLQSGKLSSFAEGTDKIIISQQLAETYFGKADPLDKVFTVAGRDVQVVGVMENVPTNSHLQFDFVIPIKFLEAIGADKLDIWDHYPVFTYIKINKADTSAVGKKIRGVIQKNAPEASVTLGLQPIADIHLKSNHIDNDMEGRSNILYVYIFSSIAIFILLIASINYSNLATARSVKRSKETGVRKVMGSNRIQLALYFFSESFLYCFIALLVALMLSWLLLPYVNELTGKKLIFQLLSADMILPLLFFTFSCALVGGAYPALMLSGQSPIVAFKGLAKAGTKAVLFRRSLIIIQFVLSICLLIGTMVIQKQLNFIASKNLGFDKERIISFAMVKKIRSNFATIKNELLALPSVKSVTANNQNISFNKAWTKDLTWEGKKPDDKRTFFVLAVDHDFLKTYSIALAAGRDFSDNLASDSLAVLLNEEAVRQMGLKDPVNKPIKFGGQDCTIIGVAKDFHFQSIHKKIEPLVIYLNPSSLFQISIKFNNEISPDQIKAAEAIFKKYTPDRPFDYTVLADDIRDKYKTEDRAGKIFTYFATLAIFVSCLGLLGIILFVTEQRAKELAVRKVLGAPVYKLMWLLTREYLAMAIIGFCIAAPVMYYAMNKWFDNFAYHVEIGIELFLVVALAIVSFAWLTVAYRSFRTATQNPVENLRRE